MPSLLQILRRRRSVFSSGSLFFTWTRTAIGTPGAKAWRVEPYSTGLLGGVGMRGSAPRDRSGRPRGEAPPTPARGRRPPLPTGTGRGPAGVGMPGALDVVQGAPAADPVGRVKACRMPSGTDGR